MRNLWSLVLLASSACANPPTAATSTAPTAPAVLAAAPVDLASLPHHPPILIKAARLFDGKSDRALTGGVAVLVENCVISKVGKPDAVAAPGDAQTIDLGDVTLLPGFIDAHTHVSGEASGNWYKDEVTTRMRPPAEQA